MQNGIWPMLVDDSAIVTTIYIFIGFVIGTVFASLLCLNRHRKYRRELRIERRFRKAEREEQMESLTSRISMLESVRDGEIARLTNELGDIKSAMKESIVFDREVVALFDDEQYIFVFVGCERQADGQFVGFYLCSVCSEKRLGVPEVNVSTEIFRDHLEECPGFDRAAAAPN
jgi:hypothetical protein